MAKPARTPSTGRPSATSPRGTAAAASDHEALGGGRAVLVSLGHRFTGPNRDVTLITAITVFLVVFGLVMVLSSSAVEEFASGTDVGSRFLRQGLFAVIGIPLMLAASRIPVTVWRRLAWPMVGVAMALQLLVFTPLGHEVYGNRNWLMIAGVTFQPSEFAKVALVVWLGLIIHRKREVLGDWRQIAGPIVLVVGLQLLLVLMGEDLGTSMVIIVLVVGGLLFGGVPIRFLAVGVGIATIGVLVLAAIKPDRVARITSFFTGNCDYENLCWQTTHGLFALAGGGLFGVGLGNSTAKWSWLPAADNDFIFAIIGEELGLVGALAVIALFIALGWSLMRVYLGTRGVGQRATIGALFSWLMFQAFVNLAVVVGFLPVLGVPLPFVSSGGSALVTTLLAMGIALSIARENAAEDAVPGARRPAGTRRPPAARRPQPNARPATTRRGAR